MWCSQFWRLTGGLSNIKITLSSSFDSLSFHGDTTFPVTPMSVQMLITEKVWSRNHSSLCLRLLEKWVAAQQVLKINRKRIVELSYTDTLFPHLRSTLNKSHHKQKCFFLTSKDLQCILEGWFGYQTISCEKYYQQNINTMKQVKVILTHCRKTRL